MPPHLLNIKFTKRRNKSCSLAEEKCQMAKGQIRSRSTPLSTCQLVFCAQITSFLVRSQKLTTQQLSNNWFVLIWSNSLKFIFCYAIVWSPNLIILFVFHDFDSATRIYMLLIFRSKASLINLSHLLNMAARHLSPLHFDVFVWNKSTPHVLSFILKGTRPLK